MATKPGKLLRKEIRPRGKLIYVYNNPSAWENYCKKIEYKTQIKSLAKEAEECEFEADQYFTEEEAEIHGKLTERACQLKAKISLLNEKIKDLNCNDEIKIESNEYVPAGMYRHNI